MNDTLLLICILWATAFGALMAFFPLGRAQKLFGWSASRAKVIRICGFIQFLGSTAVLCLRWFKLDL